MPRNAEVIRQWQILRTLDDAREGYAPHLDFELSGSLFNLSDHPTLPFRSS